MILKLRFWNLRASLYWVPGLYLLGVFLLYVNYGIFSALCGLVLEVTIGKTILDSIEIVSQEIKLNIKN